MSTTFIYRAWDAGAKVRRGTIGGADRTDAVQSLRERGYRPISVEPKGQIFELGRLFQSHPVERLGFFRSYSQLSAAGMSPGETFELLVKQSRVKPRGLGRWFPMLNRSKARFAYTIESLGREVCGGAPIYEAMARRPDTFTPLESEMVKSGIEAGEPSRVLSEVANFLERDRSFKKKLGDALLYPAIVVFVAIAVVIYLLVKVIPQFASLYAGFGVSQSGLMAALLAISNILTNPFYDVLIVGCLVATLMALVRTVSTPKGALLFDQARLQIPVIGELIQKVVVARLCRMMALLLYAGKTPYEMLETAIPIADSPVYSGALERARSMLGRGEVVNFAEAFDRVEVFEPILVGFTITGIKAGTLPTMLEKVASYYEDDVASLTSAIPIVLQTLVTIGLGLIVGTIVYAVYVPISELVTQIH